MKQHINTSTISGSWLHDMACRVPILDTLINDAKLFSPFIGEGATVCVTAAPSPLVSIGPSGINGEYQKEWPEQDR